MNATREAVAEELEERRPVSLGGLWNMNFGILGIQFGWGLQMVNMSAIYLKLHAHPDSIPILGLAGPITGLLIQPIIGAMSDRTWSSRFGRRAPYFTIGAILASIVLFFMPSSPSIWVAATSLWLLDASVNTTQEPFRAFVADKLPLKQRAAGFLMQSFFIGLGASLANALPFVLNHFGVTQEASNGVPLSVLYAFRVGAFVFLLSVLWTVFTTKEDPPADMAAFELHKRETAGFGAGFMEMVHSIRFMPLTMKQLFLVQFFTWFGLSCGWSLFTLVVAKNIYGTTNTTGPTFDRATEWAGLCGAVSSVVTFLAAPLLMWISARTGRPKTHAISLAIGGIAFLCIAFIHSKYLLLAPEVAYGIAWAAIVGLPYAILSVALPAERTGVYMGIFNFFIVLPQLAYSLIMPPIIKYVFHEDPIFTIFVGGVCFLIAAALATRVVETIPMSSLEPATTYSEAQAGALPSAPANA